MHFLPAKRFPLSALTLSLTLGLNVSAHAESDIEVIEVTTTPSATHLQTNELEELLRGSGAAVSSQGGVAALPVLGGMTGDRISVLVDGAPVTASCGNQMNPPLSYLSASQISRIEVLEGVSPVSAGGDQIAGVIILDTIQPAFSDNDQLTWQQGEISLERNTQRNGRMVSANARMASNSMAFSYAGAFDDAQSYRDGNDVLVRDTLYRAQNHALHLAMRDQVQQLAVKLSYQTIPYQGFANQYMDMTDNQSKGIAVRYQRQLADSTIFANLDWRSVDHEMGFFTPEKMGMMPMLTESDEYSAKLHWQMNPDSDSKLTLGAEYYDYSLNDWWPPVMSKPMMSPNTYVNINDGQRSRVAAFAELESQLSSEWLYSAGVRIERVSTDAGEVEPYNRMPMMGMPNMDAMAADKFNATDKERGDTLVDATLIARYQIDEQSLLSLGLARKNRAPNLYERYSWGQSPMASSMIGWFGDGNGYVGNPDLAPETAHTLSISYQRQATDKRWQVSAKTWFTDVNDYIDGEVIGQFNRSGLPNGVRNKLAFVNLDAELYGASLSGRYQLLKGKQGQVLTLEGRAAYNHGERKDSGEALYQIRPLELNLALVYNTEHWQHQAGWRWTDDKDRVDVRRLENQTEQYSLVDLKTRYSNENYQIWAALENAFDTAYDMPTSGVSVADFRAEPATGFQALPGAGRTFKFGATWKF